MNTGPWLVHTLHYWTVIGQHKHTILSCDWSTHCQVLPLYQRIAQDRDLFRRVVAENIGTEGDGEYSSAVCVWNVRKITDIFLCLCSGDELATVIADQYNKIEGSLSISPSSFQPRAAQSHVKADMWAVFDDVRMTLLRLPLWVIVRETATLQDLAKTLKDP